MPIITFAPSGKTVTVLQGTTLYDAALSLGIPVASSCSAEGVCGKCNMRVVRGAESLSPQSDLEKRLLKKERHPETDRISCQTKVLGDCTVTTGYW
jgi:ferredoxin, 2Fe-2S